MEKDCFYPAEEASSNGSSLPTQNHGVMINEPRITDHAQDRINEGSIEIIEDKLYFLSAEFPP
jgi:hypothetical protein